MSFSIGHTQIRNLIFNLFDLLFICFGFQDPVALKRHGGHNARLSLPIKQLVYDDCMHRYAKAVHTDLVDLVEMVVKYEQQKSGALSRIQVPREASLPQLHERICCICWSDCAA